MSTASLDHLDAQQLRALAERLMGEVAARDAQIAKLDQVLHFKQTHIDQLTQELALYKRWRYGKRSEQLSPAQASLLEETMDADLAAIEEEVNALREATSAKPAVPQVPRRMRLPAELQRTDIHHEPASTMCRCGCGLTRIGEDVSEKLDYRPGVFSVERHIRGKWVCDHFLHFIAEIGQAHSASFGSQRPVSCRIRPAARAVGLTLRRMNVIDGPLSGR